MIRSVLLFIYLCISFQKYWRYTPLWCGTARPSKVAIPIGKDRIPTIFFQGKLAVKLGVFLYSRLQIRTEKVVAKDPSSRTLVLPSLCCDSEILGFASNFISVSQISCHRSDHFFVDGWNISYFFCNLMDGYSYSVIFVCPSTRFCTKLNLFNRSSGSW